MGLIWWVLVVKRAILGLLDSIKSEIVPEQSKLTKIFSKLGLRDASSCKEEIENLEEDVQSQNQSNEKSKSEVISLICLIHYTECVLFEASTPDPGGWLGGGCWCQGEVGLWWWGSDLQVVGGIDGGFG